MQNTQCVICMRPYNLQHIREIYCCKYASQLASVISWKLSMLLLQVTLNTLDCNSHILSKNLALSGYNIMLSANSGFNVDNYKFE